MRYELFYLIGASKEAELPQIKSEVENIVKEKGGVFEVKETQEKRRLSYKVKHETQGTYIAQRFELEDGEKINSIGSKLKLLGGVLRFIISRTDELPELKTKEERIAEAAEIKKSEEKEAASREQKSVSRKETPKASPVEEKPIQKDSPRRETSPRETLKEDEKTQSQEDLDKKLEEILKI